MKRLYALFLLSVLCLMAFAGADQTHAAAGLEGDPDPVIRYVKVGGTGDGSSWANAMGDLDDTYIHSEIRSVFIGSTESVTARTYLYPNPAGKGWVSIETDDSQPVTGVRIFDSLGRVVRVPLTSQSGNHYLEVAHLAKGIYHVLLPGTGRAMKLVIE